MEQMMVKKEKWHHYQAKWARIYVIADDDKLATCWQSRNMFFSLPIVITLRCTVKNIFPRIPVTDFD